MTLSEKAYMFALAAHSAVGQKRKYTGEDYIHHPVEVANLVWQVYGNEEMLAAAYLHDVVEDTNVSLELIEAEFGRCVAVLVEGLTDISKPEDGNRGARKEIDRLHTAKTSPACKTIKLADLISNTRSIVKHDRDFAKVYVKEKEALLEVLTEGDPKLYEEAVSLVKSAKEELGLQNSLGSDAN